MLRPSVSFIIPCYNSFQTVERTLKSIFALNSLENVVEVIVVDSSNDEKTRTVLNGFVQPKLNLVLLEQKTSPAFGRNIGAGRASGDFLCFIDSDVFLAADWLDKVLEAHAGGCLIGCGSVSAPDFQQNNKLALAQLYLQFNESLDAGEQRPVAMVPACNMFIEKALFEKAGGFPNMRASEDVLLCLKAGEWTKVWFVPQARCFHIFRESYKSYFNNQVVLGKYIIIYRRMTYNKWYYKGLWPLLMLPGFLLIKDVRIKMRIFKAGWGHTKKFLPAMFIFKAGLFYWAVGFVQGCFSKE